jgi:hypothetical protein
MVDVIHSTGWFEISHVMRRVERHPGHARRPVRVTTIDTSNDLARRSFDWRRIGSLCPGKRNQHTHEKKKASRSTHSPHLRNLRWNLPEQQIIFCSTRFESGAGALSTC